ncbi:AAA family ATPase [Allomuricauda sp. d1]|uniref:AAA family ATPase n=1 Tax=Allomuricauda sp. d1 TaxID=3136725 RepID=UPI0031DB92E1
MIPQFVRINGYRRFINATVTLDRHLLAFVGANESGKSSFLSALLSIENTEPYEKNELTKGHSLSSNDTVVEVTYLLNKEERSLVSKFNGKGKIRQYLYSKTVDGKINHKILTKVERDKSKRSHIIKFIDQFLSKRYLQKVLNHNFFEDEVIEEIEGKSLKQLFETLLDEIKRPNDDLSSNAFNLIHYIQSVLNDDLGYINKSSQKQITILKEHFDNLLEVEEQEHPERSLLDYFNEHRPKFILFDDGDRYLKGSYTVSELASPSKAIANLLSVAGIKAESYLKVVAEKDEGERLKLQDIANVNLKKEYAESWSQSDVYPRLLLDPGAITISIISSGDNYTEVISRSEGMKMYIALKAFLSVRERDVPPILLIDEAEMHLHYAGQSDLVREFEKQCIVNSIIYTTHSAGCLPSDLGSGIKAVEVIEKDGIDSGHSLLKNSIWGNSGGFSPILLAMGANVIAMTLARKAIIAEGPSETILLPRMFRESSNTDYLDFQVAPGIATVSQEKAKDFEFEAAKLIYLADGDQGGDSIKKKLIEAGINENQIVQLDKGLSTEDYIKTEILLEAINYEFEAWGQNVVTIDPELIPDINKIGWLEKKCEKLNREFPSKVRLAEYIVNKPSDMAILESKRKNDLKRILKAIEKKLK